MSGCASSGSTARMPTGFLVAKVVTPAHLRVHAIGYDYVLGVWRDDLGVESVRMYGLER